MQVSGDYFLYRLSIVLVPAFFILIASLITYFIVISRYRRALKRLYKMNFQGIEIERKRIANDMHDQIGSTVVSINGALSDAYMKITDLEAKEQFFYIQQKVTNLHSEFRQLIESIYPKELLVTNWRESFQYLAEDLSTGNSKIEFIIEINRELKRHELYQMFRIVQEKISNIIVHSKAKKVTLQIYEDGENIVLNFTYKKSQATENWIVNKIKHFKGRGSFILVERMQMLKAKTSVIREDGFVHELIKFIPSP